MQSRSKTAEFQSELTDLLVELNDIRSRLSQRSDVSAETNSHTLAVEVQSLSPTTISPIDKLDALLAKSNSNAQGAS